MPTFLMVPVVGIRVQASNAECSAFYELIAPTISQRRNEAVGTLCGGGSYDQVLTLQSCVMIQELESGP